MDNGGDTTRILIADKVPHVRSALRLLLGQAVGLTVVGEAADAEQAVDLARTGRPDLVLLEWELPGQNGSSIVADLRKVRRGLMVVAVSARSEARAAALAAGVDQFVSKLEPPERLLAAMRECASRNGRVHGMKRELTQ